MWEKSIKMLPEPSYSKKRNALFISVAVVGAIFFLEIFASWALMLRMRLQKGEYFTKTEPTYFSLLNLPHKAGLKFGLFDRSLALPFEYQKIWEPNPIFEPDPELGYKPLPGKYRAIFSRRARNSSEWERLLVNETIKHDGTRWTGGCEPFSSTNVYIFGGSTVYGSGVNDEQTFAFLLQQARKDLCVKLFAVGGYGMTQSFIQFHKLLDQFKPDDIVILGYEDALDTRTVVAPSRLREVRDWVKSHGRAQERVMLPKAALDGEGAIQISYVQQHCDENDGYCDQRDPREDEMSRVTAELINEIAKTSSVPVYLLHYGGTKKNPVLGLLSGSVRRISALGEDCDYVSM